MENNQEQQELMFKLNIFEQQIRAVQEQLQSVEQAIVETSSLKLGLDDLKKSGGKEILASIGKGIFIKSKITSDNLVVDVGGRNFVKKSVEETQDIIEKQISKLQKIQKDLEDKLEEINEELTKTFLSAQGKNN